MLYKAIGIILSALFIVAIQVNAASAGCGGGHGFRAHQASFAHRQAVKQSKARKAQAIAAARQKKAAQQAAAKAQSSKVAKAAPAADETAAAEQPDDGKLDVAAVEETCTKFIAETGTTVTIECARQ